MHTPILLCFLISLTVCLAQVNIAEFKFHKQGNLVSDLDFAHLHIFLNYTMLQQQHVETLKVYKLFSNYKVRHADNQVSFNHAFSSLSAEASITNNLIALYEPFFPPTTIRHKRGPAGWAALGMASFNSWEIIQLKLQANAQDKVNDAILQTVKQEDLAVNINTKGIATLKRATINLNKRQSVVEERVSIFEYHQSAYDFMRHHQKVVELWGQALADALHGQLNIGLVPHDKLNPALFDLKKQIEAREFRLLRPGAEQIYTAKLSYTKEQGGLNIFIHLPVTKGEIMTVYRHINLPFPIGKLQAVVTTQEQFIAVDDDRAKGMTFTDDEFTRCTEVGDSYICPEKRVFHRDIRETCMGSLLSGTAEHIKARCNLHVNPSPRQAAVRVAKNHYFIHVPRETTVMVTCRKNSTSYTANGTQEVQLQPDCTHTFTQLSIKSESDTLGTGNMMTTVTIGAGRSETFEDWEDRHAESYYNEQIDTLEKIEVPKPVSFDALTDAINAHKAAKWQLASWMTHLMVLAAVGATAAGAFYFIRRHRQHANARAQADSLDNANIKMMISRHDTETRQPQARVEQRGQHHHHDREARVARATQRRERFAAAGLTDATSDDEFLAALDEELSTYPAHRRTRRAIAREAALQTRTPPPQRRPPASSSPTGRSTSPTSPNYEPLTPTRGGRTTPDGEYDPTSPSDYYIPRSPRYSDPEEDEAREDEAREDEAQEDDVQRDENEQ